jgi:DNA invertase Pin-like site-specific DNA recombinase
MRLLKTMLKANGRCGVPQGGVISPLLSNLYLTEVDRMLERAKEATRCGKYTYICLIKDGIGFQSLRETAIDTTTAHGRLTISILAAIAEFERELIQGRVQEGRKRAVAAGVKFGPKFKLDGFQRREALARLDACETLSAIAHTYGVNPATICRLQKRSAA